MTNVLTRLANHFNSRTVISIVLTIVLVTNAEAREFAQELLRVLPTSLENLPPELITLLSAWFFRVNANAKF